MVNNQQMKSQWRAILVAVAAAILLVTPTQHGAVVFAQRLPRGTRLRQVHVITRHGSRLPLEKRADTLEESENSLLTITGQEQHYILGTWLRARYAGKNIIDTYQPHKVRIESSQYQRTVASANALALGLLPRDVRGKLIIPATPANVPVFTKERENDIAIHGYDKCPVFLDRLNQLYQDDRFMSVASHSAKLLQNLASRSPAFADYAVTTASGDDVVSSIPLQNVWNVYDAINVARTECRRQAGPSEACIQLPDPTLADIISEEEWKNIEFLAHEAEVLKYSPQTAESMVGGVLLDQIFSRMQQDKNLTKPGDHKRENPLDETRFYVTSAHYPTILGVLTAMHMKHQQYDAVIDAGIDEHLPDYASALIFELRQNQDTHDRWVSMYYKPGSSEFAIQLEWGGACKGRTECPFHLFSIMMLNSKMTPLEWCRACSNTQVDVCALPGAHDPALDNITMASTTTTVAAASCEPQQSNQQDTTSPASNFFLGVGTAIMLLMFIALREILVKPVNRKNETEPDDIIENATQAMTPSPKASSAPPVIEGFVDVPTESAIPAQSAVPA